MILEFVLLPGDVHLQVYTERWGYGSRTIENLYRAVALTSNINDPSPQWVQNLERKHLKWPSKRFHENNGSPKEQQPGFGLMAMGKFLYLRGYPMFYGQNTFHVAPGPLTMSTHYFNALLPKHRDLIRSLTVNFTIADLTPEGFQAVEFDLHEAKREQCISFRDAYREEQVKMWTDSAIRVLDSIWRQKLEWLLTWPSLDQVTVSGPTWDLILKRGDIAKLLREALDESVEAHRKVTMIGRVWRHSLLDAQEELKAGFKERGVWKKGTDCVGRCADFVPGWRMDVEEVQDWLNGMGPGVRYKPEVTRTVRLRGRKKATATSSVLND